MARDYRKLRGYGRWCTSGIGSRCSRLFAILPKPVSFLMMVVYTQLNMFGIFRNSGWILLSILVASPFSIAAERFDWKSAIPRIRQVLNQTFPGGRVEENYPIQIRDEGDVIGDGTGEAIVWLGTGGASTDEVALMRIENGSPVVVRFKEKNGAVQASTFLRGASVMHSDDFKLVPDKHAVYSVSTRNDSEGNLAECAVTAYQWNKSTKTFDWSRSLTSQFRRQVCPKLGT